MDRQSIRSIAVLLKRLSKVDGFWGWWCTFLFDIFPRLSPPVKLLQIDDSPIDFRASPSSPLSFPFTPDDYTQTRIAPRGGPLPWMGTVCRIRLSSSPGGGSHPPGPGGVCTISIPPLTRPLKDGWINWVCLCGCVCAEMFSRACILLSALSVCMNGSCAAWRSERSSSDFPHKTLSVNLIKLQPADGYAAVHSGSFSFFLPHAHT